MNHVTQVCLSSDASKEYFQNNTRTKFVNKLPRPYVNYEGNKFTIRPLAIGLTPDITKPRPAPCHLRIHLLELEGQVEGQHYKHLLASVPVPETATPTSFAYHVFRDSPGLTLNVSTLNTLTVEITDEKDQLLELAPGPPTVVWLELESKDNTLEMDHYFTVTCSSSHPQLFPTNTPSKFLSPLPNEMSLEGYQVALQNIIFPPVLSEDEDLAKITVEDEEYEFRLTRFNTTRAFVKHVRQELGKSVYRHQIFLTVMANGPHKGKVCVGRVVDNEEDDDEINQAEELSITMNDAFAKAMGGTGDNFPNRLSLSWGDRFFFKREPNIFSVRPETISMVHCNIIEPNVVGGCKAQMLQCVPVKLGRGHSQNRSYEPEQLIYHNVTNVPLTSIGFRFTDGLNRERHFTSKTDTPLQLTLLFRKKM